MEFVCDHAYEFEYCQGCPGADPHPCQTWEDDDGGVGGNCKSYRTCLVEDSDGSPLDILVRCVPVTESHDNRGQ